MNFFLFFQPFNFFVVFFALLFTWFSAFVRFVLLLSPGPHSKIKMMCRQMVVSSADIVLLAQRSFALSESFSRLQCHCIFQPLASFIQMWTTRMAHSLLQQAVTTTMDRVCVEGTYYHKECHENMAQAFQEAESTVCACGRCRLLRSERREYTIVLVFDWQLCE